MFCIFRASWPVPHLAHPSAAHCQQQPARLLPLPARPLLTPPSPTQRRAQHDAQRPAQRRPAGRPCVPLLAPLPARRQQQWILSTASATAAAATTAATAVLGLPPAECGVKKRANSTAQFPTLSGGWRNAAKCYFCAPA